MLAVKALDHVDVKGDSASISVASPLRILFRISSGWPMLECVSHHQSCLLIVFDVKVLVKLLHLLLFQPFFSVGELAVRALDVELSCSQVPPVPKSAWPTKTRPVGYSQERAVVVTGLAIESIRRPPSLPLQKVFESIKLDALRLSQMVEDARQRVDSGSLGQGWMSGSTSIGVMRLAGKGSIKRAHGGRINHGIRGHKTIQAPRRQRRQCQAEPKSRAQLRGDSAKGRRQEY